MYPTTCPYCGAPINSGQRFCKACGVALNAGCPNCGAGVNPGAKFCKNCGASFGGKKSGNSPLPLRLLMIVSLAVFLIGVGAIVYWQLGANDKASARGPVISEISVKQTTLTSATIVWTTDVPASSQVEYGKASSYGWLAPLEPKDDPSSGTSLGVTSHMVLISGLSSAATYHFRVRSKDAAGLESISNPEGIFKTQSPSKDRYNPNLD